MLVLRASLCVFALFLSPPRSGPRESGPRSGLKGPPGPSLTAPMKLGIGTGLVMMMVVNQPNPGSVPVHPLPRACESLVVV